MPFLFEDWIEPIPADGNGENGHMTVAQVVQFFISHGPQVDSRFHKDRCRILQMFCEAHGSLGLHKAKPFHLRLWVDGKPEWKSDWRKRGVIASVCRAFNFAVKLGYVERNPFAGLSQPMGERGRPMTPQEFLSLWKATDNPFRRVLCFLWFNGARPYEARGLRWDQIDFERSCATLVKHKTEKTRKDRHRRVIILHPVTIKMLNWIRRTQEPSPFVFLNSRDRPWTRSALDLRLYRLRAKLGIPQDCKLYGTRHAMATRAAKNGVELATLAQLLGHTSTKMSEWYLHLAGETEHLQAAIRQANKK